MLSTSVDDGVLNNNINLNIEVSRFCLKTCVLLGVGGRGDLSVGSQITRSPFDLIIRFVKNLIIRSNGDLVIWPDHRDLKCIKH